jgi:hypothetical protein
MAASHGRVAVFKMGTNATPTTLANFSQYGNSVGLALTRESGEVTTFALSSKKYMAGLKDATIPFEGPFDDASDLIMWDIYNNGTEVSWEYFPAGETAGRPKYSGKLIVTSYEVSSDVADPNSTSGEFQVSGDVARGVAP